jgi:hypothetical protein
MIKRKPHIAEHVKTEMICQRSSNHVTYNIQCFHKTTVCRIALVNVLASLSPYEAEDPLAPHSWKPTLSELSSLALGTPDNPLIL